MYIVVVRFSRLLDFRMNFSRVIISFVARWRLHARIMRKRKALDHIRAYLKDMTFARKVISFVLFPDSTRSIPFSSAASIILILSSYWLHMPTCVPVESMRQQHTQRSLLFHRLHTHSDKTVRRTQHVIRNFVESRCILNEHSSPVFLSCHETLDSFSMHRRSQIMVNETKVMTLLWTLHRTGVHHRMPMIALETEVRDVLSREAKLPSLCSLSQHETRNWSPSTNLCASMCPTSCLISSCCN